MVYNRGYYTEAHLKKEIMGLLATVATLPSLPTAHDFFFGVGFGNILIWSAPLRPERSKKVKKKKNPSGPWTSMH